MVFNSFEELWKDRKPMRCMYYEELKSFVEDMYDTYEAMGFTETFKSAWKDYKEYDGQKYTVLSRLTEKEADLGDLPMWHIVFEDGVETDAFPDEICLAEREDRR